MKPVIKLYAGLITACCMLFAGSLYAGKAPTVPICHWDDDTGAFKLKQVNGNALTAHLGHGDEIPEADPETTSTPLDAKCELVVNPPAVIARAYINVDKADGYYGDGSDIPIVEVLDVDGNSTVSSGDVVRFGQFPTALGYECVADDADCYAVESIDPLSLTVDGVFTGVGVYVDVGFVENTMRLQLVRRQDFVEVANYFSPADNISVIGTSFELNDYHDRASTDEIFHPGGVDRARCDDPFLPQCFDNAFLNVDFY